MGKRVRLKANGISDIGLVRKDNEDYYILDEEQSLFIVADGLGGHCGGEIASKAAAEAIQKYFKKATGKELQEEDLENKIKEAIQAAHQEVLGLSANTPELKGSGTTIVTALFKAPYYLYVANVGDSRAYLFRDKKLELLSQDHSVVAQLVQKGEITQDETRTHSLRNIVTQAIGIDIGMGCYQKKIEAKDKDIIMLCSDGLWDMLSDKDIEKIVKEKATSPQNLCSALIEAANSGGGEDNITVISIFFYKDEPKISSKTFAKLQKQKV
ncbi:MAG: Stp1/IreP family PP2C-type Ser/Thr phosphatase [Candidatus Omnitrophota bacterium]